jgi:hypothetical protein
MRLVCTFCRMAAGLSLAERTTQGMRWELFGHCCWFTGRSGKRRGGGTIVSINYTTRIIKGLQYRPAGVYARSALPHGLS